jgi:hypothetical protein
MNWITSAESGREQNWKGLIDKSILLITFALTGGCDRHVTTMEDPRQHMMLRQREQVLKKLLLKVCMRAEVERLRANPTCWRDGEANPLLHRSLCALRTCPLLRDAALGDGVFQQCIAALPALAAELKAIDGKDLLITLANDLGNFWQLILLTEEEGQGAEPLDVALFDDLDERQDEDGGNYAAGARALREQSMRSFKAALSEIAQMSGGFSEAYQVVVGAASVEQVAPPSVQLAIVHAFDAMDYVITHSVLADNVRRKDFKRKAKQLSNPLLGPLLNAANPFFYLPSFVRLAIRTGIAERLVLRDARRKLSEAQHSVPHEVGAAILQYVEQGKANIAVSQLSVVHVQQIVGSGTAASGVNNEGALHLLKHAVLVWQKRQLMQLVRRDEFAFLLDHIVPTLGTPLAELYEELRIGDELRHIGLLLQSVARRTPCALQDLRSRLFSYITATLRHPGAHKLQHLLVWLIENLTQPQVISLHALVAHHVQQADVLWAEVDEARARLLRGEHFHDLSLPMVRLLAPHFHAQLRAAPSP